MESAVGAIRAGAYDFIVKPVELETLSLTLERAAKHSALTREVKHLRQVVDATTNLHDVYGTSGPMQDLFDLVNHVADTEATVLVTGESGTGKELIARALHRGSRRRDGPFIAINCGAIPENLLEAELFGHARGAFTDAKDARRGLLLAADGGTLLLDEIGEMPLGMQVKLLRALQERTVRPLGTTQEQPFDTRLIAATQRDLEQEARDGRFREDLYYRVNVVHIHVPPLRARGADILLLAQHFLERAAKLGGRRIDGLSPEATERLMTYHWPGNVRELQNAMERAAALTRTPEIGAQDLPDRIRHYRAPGRRWT
jgi:two-component system response regulator HydG